VLSSHYMDEVEALAHNVVVLARGQVVATGPPASLGGRDRGRVTIRFSLPPSTPADALPVARTAGHGDEVEIETDDEVRVLAVVTTWALDRGIELRGLSVTRETLEDIYLGLTGADDGPPTGQP